MNVNPKKRQWSGWWLRGPLLSEAENFLSETSGLIRSLSPEGPGDNALQKACFGKSSFCFDRLAALQFPWVSRGTCASAWGAWI